VEKHRFPPEGPAYVFPPTPRVDFSTVPAFSTGAPLGDFVPIRARWGGTFGVVDAVGLRHRGGVFGGWGTERGMTGYAGILLPGGPGTEGIDRGACLWQNIGSPRRGPPMFCHRHPALIFRPYRLFRGASRAARASVLTFKGCTTGAPGKAAGSDRGNRASGISRRCQVALRLQQARRCGGPLCPYLPIEPNRGQRTRLREGGAIGS
jgi:hypothetical protein